MIYNFAFTIHIEFCLALWNYVRNVVSLNYVRQVGWSLARRNSGAVLGRLHFPTLFSLSIIYSNYYQCLAVVQITDESITFELGRHVSGIIGLIEQNTCQCDFIQFSLDSYNAVVRDSFNFIDVLR